MTRDIIVNHVQEIFRDIFNNKHLVISDETTANEIKDWDSLNHINLISSIEKEFKIEFALGELQGLQNVGAIINLILKKSTN